MTPAIDCVEKTTFIFRPFHKRKYAGFRVRIRALNNLTSRTDIKSVGHVGTRSSSVDCGLAGCGNQYLGLSESSNTCTISLTAVSCQPGGSLYFCIFHKKAILSEAISDSDWEDFPTSVFNTLIHSFPDRFVHVVAPSCN